MTLTLEQVSFTKSQKVTLGAPVCSLPAACVTAAAEAAFVSQGLESWCILTYSCLDATCYSLWSSRFALLLHLSSVFCFLPRVICCLQSTPLPPVLLLKLTVGCVYTCLCGSFHVFLHVICIRVLESFHVWFCVRMSIRVRVWRLQVSVGPLPCFLPPYCSGVKSLKLEPFQSSKLLSSELHGFCRSLPAVQVVNWRDKPGSQLPLQALYQQSRLSSPTWP